MSSDVSSIVVSVMSFVPLVEPGYASALALRASNSCCVIAPALSSSCPLAIWVAGSVPVPAACADVVLLRRLRGLLRSHRPLGHALPASDQVDEHRQERHQEQEDDPPVLAKPLVSWSLNRSPRIRNRTMK